MDYRKILRDAQNRLRDLANSYLGISKHVDEADFFFQKFVLSREFIGYFSEHVSGQGITLNKNSAKDASKALKQASVELFSIVSQINDVLKNMNDDHRIYLALVQRLEKARNDHLIFALAIIDSMDRGFISLLSFSEQLEMQKKEIPILRGKVTKGMSSRSELQKKEALLQSLEGSNIIVESALKRLKKDRKTLSKVCSHLFQDFSTLGTSDSEQLNIVINELRDLAKTNF